MKLWTVIFAIAILIFVTLGYFYSKRNTEQNSLPAVLQKSYNFAVLGEFDSAWHYADKVISEAHNSNNIAFAQSILGYCRYVENDYDSAYHYYTVSYETSQISDSIDYTLQIKCLMMIGVIFERLEEHKKAIDYFRNCLDILEGHETDQIVNVYYNMAYNQSQVSDISCVDSYYTALKYATKYELKRSETLILNDLGNLMRENGNYKSAIEHYQLTLASEYGSQSTKYSAFGHQGLGEVYYHTDSLQKAEFHLNKALELKNEIENQKYKFITYLFLARVKSKQMAYEKAEKYYNQAIELFPQVALTRKNIKIFEELSQVEAALSKHEKGAQSKIRYYAEIENYLDQQERARQLVKQDEFGGRVLAKAKELQSEMNLSFILNTTK